jgi:hypothetical protein
MYKDEIIAEVWRNRDAFAQQHHHNLSEIVTALHRREQEHPERVVAPQPRRPAQTTAPAK